VTFKLIPDSINYYAGDDGNIYSNFGKGFKKLKASIQSTGKYYQLSIIKNRTRKHYRVHRLVCEAFHGIPKEGMTCSHLDGNWRNNKPDNLKWETYSENLERKKEHGTDDVGYKNSRARIDKCTLDNIRFLLSEGLGPTEIGKRLNLPRLFIQKIKSGYRYKGQ